MKSTDIPDFSEMDELVKSLQNPNRTAARKPNRERYSYENGWPEDVWSIGIDRIDLLGVDEKGNLFWNGQPIEIKRSLSLTWGQRVGAFLIASAAVVGAIAAVVQAYAALQALP
ncbi:hypothetical protein [Novosphingobium sp. TCA1]|uniref:hypothetical protein n=1 Tax=Novosphingobium sp. TCA1 TaxID=2682474 RepID=UPI00130D30B7|nr:hypothetical protein [Novosphingobium sp. TCA1]GFE76248.1 hypothetical protein NTCA1_38970 [Novosphingobium sp. TCA1]